MKRSIILIFCIFIGFTSCDELNKVVSTLPEVENLTPSTNEIVQGLKAALEKGTLNGVSDLSAVGGYANNALYKIQFPPSAQKVESTLRGIGLDNEIDRVISLLNKGAEHAVTEAKPIFLNAIKGMSIADAKGILFGNDTAATSYLKEKTRADLYNKFKPHIQNSLNEVNATKYWNDIMNQYNRIPLVEKIDPDLNNYVTNKAIDGLFLKISQEEAAIRKNPLERTSSILQKVFNYADSNK